MARAIGYGGASVYNSSVCHYCDKPATTDDHIVPRCAFSVHQSALPYWFRQHNIAPCCKPCNNFKDRYRSDCVCDQCSWVWAVASALFIKEDFVVEYRQVIEVAEARI